jgi:hypothetical protein
MVRDYSLRQDVWNYAELNNYNIYIYNRYWITMIKMIFDLCGRLSISHWIGLTKQKKTKQTRFFE